MGFSAIKNVGIQVAEHIVAERNKGQFQSFDDFVSRMPSGDLNKKSLESLILAGVFDTFGVTRRSLFNVYEKMIEDAHKSVRDNVSGQLDMFSMGEESSISASAYDYPNLPEFSMRDLLRMEKELMGICFSGNFLATYKNHIEELRPDSIQDVLCGEEHGYKDRQSVRVAGMITGKTVKKTKNGEAMAFLTLEDSVGKIEIIVFPKQYEQFLTFLETDMAVCVTGQISLRENEATKIILNNVIMLQNDSEKKVVVKPPKGVRLCIKLPSLNCPEATQVYTLLRVHRGEFPVILYDASQNKYVKATGYETERSEALTSSLQKILGNRSVLWQEFS